MEFSRRELRDLGVAWIALGAAFTILLNRRALQQGLRGDVAAAVTVLGPAFLVSMVTVGVGFLLHELAHKVVAVRFGQIAEFRADYGMLFLALVGSFAGFLFAAPGAVHHRGRITEREHGLIALAGPVTNLVLAVAFTALFFALAFLDVGGVAAEMAWFGLSINLLLAGFNMIPFGPLDGRTVLDWNRAVYAVVAVPSVALAAVAVFVLL